MDNLSSTGNEFLEKINQVIDENLGNELYKIEDLAKELGLSRSMLHRKLKKLTGKSASEFISEKRLEKAQELLIISDLTSAEIAYKIGFSSPSYFNKVFKKFYKISPGDFRKGKMLVPVNRLAGAIESKRHLRIFVLSVSTVLLAIVLLLAGVKYFTRETTVSEKSIAILPFDNLSSDNDNQYFADGIVEDLLIRLSSLNSLKVISRTSSEMFRNKGGKTIPEIAQMLGVNYILEGTVQNELDNIRISVQLIDAKRDDHVLSKQYDKKIYSFFEIQREIASEIAHELSLVLTDVQADNLKHDFTQNITALKLYQLGRFHSNKRTAEGYKRGIECYEKAITEDPAYGLAYAGLADNYHLMSIQGHIERTKGNNIALEMAEKALNLEPGLSEAYTVMASIYTYIDLNWEAAEKEFLKALELNPNYSTAHQYYAEFLTIMGRSDEARNHIDIALQLDPFSFIMRYRSSRMYYDQERYKEALTENKFCLALNNEHPWALNLEFDINLALKDDSSVMDCLRRTAILWDKWTPMDADSVYNMEGIEGIKRWVTGLNNFDPEYTKAIFFAMLGEYENALDMLELAMEAHALTPSATTKIEYKPLRSNPRFIAIRTKMGLPPL